MPSLGPSLVPAVHYTSTTHEDTNFPSSSNLNGKHHLLQQVANLINAIAQQTTLVNQLLERIEMQRAPDEVSRSKIRAEERDLFQRHPDKKSLSPPRTVRSGSVHSRLGPRGNVLSCLNTQKIIHSRLSLRVSVYLRLVPHFDGYSGHFGRSIHTRLSL
ncbi:hypothetical protein ACFX10_029646 [Malus domestica]